MKTMCMVLVALVLMCPGTSLAKEKDAFFDVKLSDLDIVEGKLPAASGESGDYWWIESAVYPWVVVESGEGYFVGLFYLWSYSQPVPDERRVVVRAPAGKTVEGTLFFPVARKDGVGTDAVGFKIPAKAATPGAENSFKSAKADHYARLQDRRIPGSAWFRHQKHVAQGTLPDLTGATPPPPSNFGTGDLGGTFDLFTGGRALSENLQLDRVLLMRTQGEDTVDVSTLAGITVEEIDWTPYNKGLNPKKDFLSAYMPADQYALFFPSFNAMVRLMDEADAYSTPVLAWMEPRSEDGLTKDRYQKQLCLSTSFMARLLGPQVVASVAFTGSDPFLRMGSDVAVLFQASNKALLLEHVRGKQDAAAAAYPTAAKTSGTVEGLEYTGVCSPDRVVCSYLAQKGDVVIVANSTVQLAGLARAAASRTPAMNSLGEYTFFRNRYPIGDKKESALLIVPDQAIRRWCSPKWRIADSRRVRAAAIMSELQAAEIGSHGPDAKARTFSSNHEPRTTNHESLNTTYGTLGFMTPIAEMSIDKVTSAEAEAYKWFRDGYQDNWRNYFDPIAVRFGVEDKSVTLDLSVMPLIAGSEYREFLELTEGSEMSSGTGDPHKGVLALFGMALNPNSEPIRKVGSFAVSMAPGLQANVMSWLGKYVVLYADQDAFWDELIKAEKPEEFMEKNFHRLPVAIQVDVSSAMKVTAFLASIRAFVEQSAPGMTIWETLKHKGQPYVKVSPSLAAREQESHMPEQLALYYAVTPDSLLVTLSESLLKRSLERRAGAKGSKGGAAWPGKHLNLQADASLLRLLENVGRKDLIREVQLKAWGNIPILNEWKRMFPDEDPVAVHERLWHARLLDPGSGKYVWNEKHQTMESTTYGHPGAPRPGPVLLRPPLSDLKSGTFGLTFENDGLRAVAEFLR